MNSRLFPVRSSSGGKNKSATLAKSCIEEGNSEGIPKVNLPATCSGEKALKSSNNFNLIGY
jgi:hypothetical protein